MKRIVDKQWVFYAGVLVALLPLMAFRDFTSDNELRYLSIVDEALRNHDFFAFYNHGIPYADKPPLYFWFLMLCHLIAGRHCMWLAAMGSLLPAFGVIAVMQRWTSKRGGLLVVMKEQVAASRMMLMTCAYFLGAAVILRMDMLMCLFIVLSLYTFWKLYEGKGRNRDKWLFPVYLFLALFTKGPLGILIPLCSTIVFLAIKRDIRQFPRFWGWRTWGVLLGLCILWFASVYADGGKEYLDNLLFHQTIDRAVDSFHHKRPFYYYLVAMWYIIAPWSLYVVGSIIADLRHPSSLPSIQQYFITISLTTLVLLSCISSKLQIYFLPAVPFMVYSAMISLPKYKDKLLSKLAIEFPAAVFALALPAVVIMHFSGIQLSVFVWMAALILTAGGITCIVVLFRENIYTSVKCMGVTLFAALFVAGWAIPQYNEYVGYGELCAKAAEVSKSENSDKIYTWRIKRPENMDVYLSRDVIIIDDDSIPEMQKLTDGILLTKKKDAEILSQQPAVTVGKYVIIK